ncbi:MAG: hypothetical protein KAR42_14675 [candidate division Zixibacteria bacterium]|nr:hypothetical protein [candidate division Zixibacteria bacterium]
MSNNYSKCGSCGQPSSALSRFIEPTNNCTECGGEMVGDGYTMVLHCENADEKNYEFHEPDAGPIYCNFEDK